MPDASGASSLQLSMLDIARRHHRDHLPKWSSQLDPTRGFVSHSVYSPYSPLRIINLSDGHKLFPKIHQLKEPMGHVQTVISNTPETEKMTLMMNKNLPAGASLKTSWWTSSSNHAVKQWCPKSISAVGTPKPGFWLHTRKQETRTTRRAKFSLGFWCVPSPLALLIGV